VKNPLRIIAVRVSGFVSVFFDLEGRLP